MPRTPFCVTSRSERFLNRLGTHSSTAMAASVRGPSTNPVCAATNRSAPSEISVNATIGPPMSKPPIRQPRVSDSQSEALSVLPGSNATWFSR